ncbi:MAG TPA: hypothetical protein VKD08_09990, partial [Ignavibacteriaceae bacterium]|nr:hypothetical protein [Ignavibacteriaceae bacterium]
YAEDHPGEGYRRLTYMMLDDNIAAVSPSTTYRVLKQAGLLNKYNKVKKTAKGLGFDQPTAAHQHWHTDIKYVNFHGTFLFFISVIDGYCRYMVHHELRLSMQEYDAMNMIILKLYLMVSKIMERFLQQEIFIIPKKGLNIG